MATGDKLVIKRLTAANKDSYLLEWKTDLGLIIKAEDAPTNYPGSAFLNEHLTKIVPMPLQPEYMKTVAGAGNIGQIEVNDTQAFFKALRAWSTADAMVCKIVLKYLGDEYKKIFSRAADPESTPPGTARSGWLALMSHLNHDIINRSDVLSQKIDNLMQQDDETMREYADRAYDLMMEYKALGDSVEAFNIQRFGKKFREGFKDGIETMKYFRALNIWNDFSKQREQLIADDQQAQLFATKAKLRNEKRQDPGRALIAEMIPPGDYQRDPNKPKLTANGGPSSSCEHCKQGPMLCPKATLGYCPDCFKCGYFGHKSRDHTDEMLNMAIKLQGQTPPRQPNRQYKPKDKPTETIIKKGTAMGSSKYVGSATTSDSEDAEEDDDLEMLYNKDAFNYPLRIQHAYVAGISNNQRPKGGIVDSGSSRNMVNLPSKLANIQHGTPGLYETATSSIMKGSGQVGDYHLTTTVNGKAKDFKLVNVEYVKDVTHPLWSVWSMLKDQKQDVWFKASTMGVYIGKLNDESKHEINAEGVGWNGSFYLPEYEMPSNSAKLSAGLPREKDQKLWHQRGLHGSYSQMQRTVTATRGMVLQNRPISTENDCESCVIGKMPTLPYPSNERVELGLLDIVEVDATFSSRDVPSLGGSVGILVFTLKAIGFHVGYGFQNKNEAAGHIQFFLKWIERISGEKVKAFQTDDSGEIAKNNFLLNLFKSVGITLRVTGTDAHQQLGTEERFHRTMWDGVRATLEHAQADKRLWLEACLMKIYVHNRQTHGNETVTPYEKLYKYRPQVSHLRVPFCNMFAKTLPKVREVRYPPANSLRRITEKLGARAVPGVFIGYGDYDGQPVQRRGWKIILNNSIGANSVAITRNAWFDEENFSRNSVTTTDLAETEWPVEEEDESDRRRLTTNVDLAEHQLTQPATIPWSSSNPIVLAEEDEEDNFIDAVSGSDGDSEVSTPLVSAPESVVTTAPSLQDAPSVESGSPTPPLSATRRGRSAGPVGDFSRVLGEDGLVGGAKLIQGLTCPIPVEDIYFVEDEALFMAHLAGHFTSDLANDPLTLTAAYKTYLTRTGPSTLREALASPEAPLWTAAMKSELDGIGSKGTYGLTFLPADANLLTSGWVFTVKINDETLEERFKARLVIHGCRMIGGKDYHDTYSPAANSMTNCILSAIAASRKMFKSQFDAVLAFLNADVDTDVYVKQPPGWVLPGYEHMVWKLVKALYGIKQAPRLWNQKLTSLLLDARIGMTQSSMDPTLYFKRVNDHLILLNIQVDDGRILYDFGAKEEVRRIMKELSTMINIKTQDLDASDNQFGNTYNGVHYQHHPDGSVSMDQHAYLDGILQEFENQFGPLQVQSVPWKDVPNLADFSDLREPTTQERLFGLDHDLQVWNGKVGYMIHSRPELAYALSQIAQYLSKPRPCHWYQLVGILGYLKGTKSLQRIFRSSQPLELIGYGDADHAVCPRTRKSIGGIVIMLGGSSVYVQSKKQPTISDSTAVSELVTSHRTSQRVVVIRKLLHELGLTVSGPTSVKIDNEAAHKIVTNRTGTEKVKHADIKLHVLRELIDIGVITYDQVSTGDMLADICTKGLGKNKFEQFRLALGVTTIDTKIPGSVDKKNRAPKSSDVRTHDGEGEKEHGTWVEVGNSKHERRKCIKERGQQK